MNAVEKGRGVLNKVLYSSTQVLILARPTRKAAPAEAHARPTSRRRAGVRGSGRAREDERLRDGAEGGFEDQQMEGGETACTAGGLLLDGVNYGEVRTLLETCIRINRMSAASVLTTPPARALARLGRTHLTRGVICTCVSSAARRDGSRTADGGLR